MLLEVFHCPWLVYTGRPGLPVHPQALLYSSSLRSSLCFIFHCLGTAQGNFPYNSMLSCTFPWFHLQIPSFRPVSNYIPTAPLSIRQQYLMSASDCYFWFAWTPYPPTPSSDLTTAQIFPVLSWVSPHQSLEGTSTLGIFCLVSSQVRIYPLLSGVRLCWGCGLCLLWSAAASDYLVAFYTTQFSNRGFSSWSRDNYRKCIKGLWKVKWDNRW